MHGETGIEHSDRANLGHDLVGEGLRHLVFDEPQLALIDRQAIEGGPVQAGKALKPVQSAFFFKDMRQKRHGVGGGETARAAAGMFLQRIGMRRGIGAKEKARLAPGRRAAQRKAVMFALGHRQAIVMRLDPAHKDVVAVDDQVMGGNRRPQIGAARAGIVGAFDGGDVFHHDPQLGQAAAQAV